MKMHITTLLLTGLLVFSCADKKAVVDTPDTTASAPPEKTPAKNPQFGGPGASDSLFFFMERTPCFGQCKAYRITVYRSGYATFEGRSNVEREGMHYGFVGKDSLETLMRDAEKAGFFELNDKYDSNITDLPSSVIRIVGGGKDKRVMARVGTPANFRAYFEQAESMLFPIAWKPLPAQE